MDKRVFIIHIINRIMNFKRGLKSIGFLLITIGLFIIIIQPFSTTGAVIDLSTAVSRIWFFIGLGIIVVGVVMFVLTQTRPGIEKIVRIKGNLYEPHAVERMKKRGLFPTVINSVIKDGDYYRLSDISDFGEAKGATRAYIGEDIAEIAPGERFEKRSIHIDPERKREYDSVIVLTDDDNVIKTTYVANDRKLNWFLNKYTSRKDKKK